MNKICAYIFIVGVIITLFPQSLLYGISPEKAISKGLKFWETDQADSAVYYFEIARKEAIKVNDWESWVKASEKMGRTLTDQGKFDRGKAVLDSAIMVGEDKLGKDHLATLNAISQLGIYYQYFGEYKKALDYHLEILEILESNPNTHDTLYAGIYERLALDYYFVEEFDKAIDQAQRGIELLRPHVSPNNPKLGIFENLLGAFSAEHGRNDEALLHYQRAIDIFLTHYDSSNSRIIVMIGNMGNLAMDAMDYQKAYRYFSSMHPYIDHAPVLTQSINFYSTGLVLNLMGDYEQGTMYLEEARKRISTAPGAYQPQLANIEYELARALTEAADYDKAIIHLNKSLEIFQSLEEGYSSDESNCLLLLGIILHEQKKYELAYQKLVSSQKVLIDLYGENHPQVANSYSLIGQTLMELNQIEKARSYFQKVLKIYAGVLPSDHPYYNETLVELAITYRVTKDFQPGIDLCKQAIKALTDESLDPDKLTPGQFSPYWSITKVDKALSEYAILLKEKYKTEGDVNDLQIASVLFRETLTILDSIRQTFQTSSSRSEIIREYDYVYEEAVETEFLLYQATNSLE
ncbi:MAG: tetratricopeptide repeat protein, partial [Bacteroidetes bacterium]|nr:tetratricopeptide repeat protein [Bacteroidota bacterium]